LGSSLNAEPGSARFYRQTLGLAALWTLGGLATGPVRLAAAEPEGLAAAEPEDLAAEQSRSPGEPRARPRGPVVGPVLLGVAAFAVFYLSALVARRIPVLGDALRRVLSLAHDGSVPVALTTLANGAAEEVFFRGAVYAAAGKRHPLVTSTAVYALITTATRNPALVCAAAGMGTLFGWQRRATGGIQASTLTHLTWSALMLRFLPPLFTAPASATAPSPDPGSAAHQ
jgi:membrane protease YdiL (CAAX protease family)